MKSERSIAVLLVSVLLALAVPAAGEEPAAAPAPTAVCEKDKSCGKLVEAEKKKEAGLNLKVSFGFKADRAGEDSVSDLSLGFNLNHGTYPNEIRVRADTKFREEDGETSEDVSNVLFNFDHHIRHNVQLFAFTERFVDSFLSIDQRWEAGLGAKWEENIRDNPARQGAMVVDSHSPSDLRRILHPTDVGLTCTRRGKKSKFQPKTPNTPPQAASGSERPWYRLTSRGYLQLEAWAGEFKRLYEKVEKLKKLRGTYCDRCGSDTGASGVDPLTEEETMMLLFRIQEDLPIEAVLEQSSNNPSDPCKACQGDRKKLLELIDGALSAAKKEKEALQADFCAHHARSLEKRYSRLQYGISAAILWELENATLDNPLAAEAEEMETPAGETEVPETLPLPGMTRARLSIRPSIVYRPTDTLELWFYYFYKLGLDSPRRGPNGSKDIREDLILGGELSATEKISLRWTATWRGDDVPPFLEPTDTNGLTEILFAEDNHWIYDIKVSISL